MIPAGGAAQSETASIPMENRAVADVTVAFTEVSLPDAGSASVVTVTAQRYTVPEVSGGPPYLTWYTRADGTAWESQTEPSAPVRPTLMR